MDLLDRINALTDDQLRMVAERDDASGVLAAYRLAELRGLPYPDREAAILGDGYVIVAQAGQIHKLPIEAVSKVIREQSGEYCVYSEDGSRSFGCYTSMEQAEERLRQIHIFRAALREGSFVSWNSSGGRARGQIEHIMREGVLGIPGSSFEINAEPDDPAVLIRIWREFADGWKGTETLVGHKMSTLTSIEPLSKQATKREDDEDFPAEAFAYVPDPERPSTWKLRLWDSLEEKVTAAQVGRALAALGPGGFRGNRVEIPAADLPAVRREILAAWRTVHEADAEIPEVLKEETFVPPKGVQEAAQRALDWIAAGHAGSGFTDVGRARAAQLARGDAVSETTIRRMNSYLARHRNDSQAEGFNAGEDGFPSPGRVAWDAWGGDPAVSWVEGIMGRITDEKQYDPDVVLTPRQKLMYEKYEWIAETLGPWDGSTGPDGAHYISASDNVFADAGMKCANCVFFEGGGGCEILDQAVEPEAECKLWIIPADQVKESLKSLSKDRGFLRKQAAARFTLGPLYVPDFMDAHGEWTDGDELQRAVWGWVQSGDRTIYLQHDREVRAGEWVEVMTMPQPWTVDMLNGQGESLGKITYPAGTVFLGVIWDEKPWQDIIAGRLRGYSIGGFSDRVLADLPEEAARDGIELTQEPTLAKSIADAVAEAMRQSQPVVNVVMPEPGKAKVRRIERDEHGNIARIIEEDE
jgi:hypothetical protein